MQSSRATVEQLESEKRVMGIELKDAIAASTSLKDQVETMASSHEAELRNKAKAVQAVHAAELKEAVEETARRIGSEWRARTTPQVESLVARVKSFEEQLKLERDEHRDALEKLHAKNRLLENRI